uniref:Uncharacterized protein n=1 Tax=Tetranychus urticae TaxID=32264 RepID=T1KZ93_TETUR
MDNSLSDFKNRIFQLYLFGFIYLLFAHKHCLYFHKRSH